VLLTNSLLRRIYTDGRDWPDKSDPTLLRNDIITIDHALTRPWTAQNSYRRAKTAIWIDGACSENNEHVRIGTEDYVKNGYDGLLRPARKDPPPPDLRYFKPVKR
jgi:hypothetical protein